MGSLLRLPPEARASQHARAFVGRELAGALDADGLAVAQLLVSELVTNAVVHAASALDVECDRDEAGVTVRVRDADTGPLVLSDSEALELGEGGRGFVLIDQLSDAWGTEHRSGRKTVWFRLVGEKETSSPAPQPPRPPGPAANGQVLRTAERRLGTLLLPPPIERVLSFDEQLRELLSRVVDAVGAVGGEVRAAGSGDAMASYGRTSARPAHREDLVLEGRTLGTLTVFGGGVDEEDDRAFLRVAAQRLSVLAYERGALDDESMRAAEPDYLSEATELLTTTVSVRSSLTLLMQLVIPRLGDWSGAYRVDERGRAQRVAAHHRREERLDALIEILENDRELLGEVADAAAGGPARRLPLTITVGGQRGSVVVVPLVSRSRTLGVLVLGRPQPFDAVGFASLLELSRRAGLAIDNARLHEEQATAATALQAALLPGVLPRVPGLQLAARYHSAAPGMLVGGDFYDAFELADGSVVCAIGDVCGKGAEAAAVTGMSRDLLRVLLRDGLGLAAALQRLNRALIEDAHSSRFCTVVLGRITFDDGMKVHLCLAGHPEPVVLRADGSTELVGTPGDLLGVITGDLSLTETTVALAPGDSLVLYTDGITERRDGSRMFGRHGVQQTLRRAVGTDAATLAKEVETAARSFVDTELRDDLAVLVARRLPAAGSGSRA